MSSAFRAHRVLAVIVLVAAGAWVATGEFAAVGSEEVSASEGEAVVQAADAAPAEAAAPLRTVLAVVPTFIEHAREIRIAGVTEADKITVLAARSNGIVEELGVVQGDDIAANALVLRLEGADVTAMVETAQASLLQATEQLDVGENLFNRGSLPELELTARRSAKAAAEAALSQALAGADRLLLNAPFDGIVDSVDVDLGEWVQAGAPIATILSLDPIIVKAEVSERDVASVSIGSDAVVRLVTGVELHGQVQHVANQASEETRTFIIEVALPNADRAIPSGMTAEVSLFAAPQTAVIVPRSVITLSEDGRVGLRVVGEDNIAQFVPVILIDDTGDGMIVAGVPADVRIITAGQDLVRDGDEVIVSVLDPAATAEIGQ
jgi:membrane fusion protein, multidrug efflux system